MVIVILVTGGLGFIGLHTARALLDLGEDCVLTQYRVARSPEFIADDLETKVFVEQLDVTDAESFAAIGKKYDITGIVHLAVPGMGALGPFEDFEMNTKGLLNALRAANDWGVKRITIASSIAVYAGVREVPLREEMPLPMTAGNPTETFKKSFELLSNYVSGRAGFEAVSLRISGIYGPLYHSMANLPSRLVHAAVKGVAPDVAPPRGPVYAEDGSDLCYVKDCGRSIALLQLAESLEHRTYNVAAGRTTTNKALLAAVQRAVPGFELELLEGFNPRGSGVANYLDISRAHAETGYEPAFDLDASITDYVAWLRDGNPE
jgi:UDP-glucose 4-epimerase